MAKRWEQQVVKAGCYNDVTGPYTVKLLARQHAAVVRMVKKQLAMSMNWTYEGWVPGYRKACEDVLAALATHRKGGRDGRGGGAEAV